MQQRILVWDVPTRLFHWLMVLSFLGAFATGDSERWRDVHVTLGCTLSGLMVASLLHRENLALSMITGYKSGDGAQGIRRAHWIMGSALALGVLTYWLGLY